MKAALEQVYQIWNERLDEWWCPKTWYTELVELDLRAGGFSHMVMRGSAGKLKASKA